MLAAPPTLWEVLLWGEGGFLRLGFFFFLFPKLTTKRSAKANETWETFALTPCRS